MEIEKKEKDLRIWLEREKEKEIRDLKKRKKRDILFSNFWNLATDFSPSLICDGSAVRR